MNHSKRKEDTRDRPPDVQLHIERLVLDRAVCGGTGAEELQAELQDRLRELLRRESFQFQDRQQIRVASVAPLEFKPARDFSLRSLAEEAAGSIVRAVSRTMAPGQK